MSPPLPADEFFEWKLAGDPVAWGALRSLNEKREIEECFLSETMEGCYVWKGKPYVRKIDIHPLGPIFPFPS
ncbi:hypothetical protein GCM10022402_43750 [Salinactinospora qingdaonensis]|uniref:Uncharacterized protein n=1 Tax=Salinactinospora qingdaonensis TaxID=702744 RepID=A0ABP7GFX6_9ACTN